MGVVARVTECPAAVSRTFLPWDRPLLAQAVSHLAGSWRGDGPLDLSRLLVVVPTSQSGRRLREALAVHAAGFNQGVFAPQVVTPDRLLAGKGPDRTAVAVETLLAWVEVLAEIDLAACRNLFPRDPPARDFAWALGLARTFHQLQLLLAEGGRRLADVVRAVPDHPELERWRELGALERLHDARLARRGKLSPAAAAIAGAADPPPRPDVARMVVLATPDPLQLALKVLAWHAASIPVEIVVHADAAETAAFDPWGRPLPDAWLERELALPDFDRHVHLCADPAAQADWANHAATSYDADTDTLALGIADRDALPALEGALRRSGHGVFNPEGRARRDEAFFQLLVALAEFERAAEFPAVSTLARCPDILAFLGRRRGPEFSVARWLAGLDELQARHLPADLAAAERHAPHLREFPTLADELALLVQLRGELRQGGFGESASRVLTTIFAGGGQPAAEASATLAESAGAWMEVVRECDAAAAASRGRSRSDWWQLALAVYGEGRVTGEKPAGALELQGWLELAWEDAPHLVVVGCNDGRVPEAITSHAFLPESLRRQLGLKTNDVRFARDAYLLQTLATTRAARGRLDLLFGKFSSDGEPLRPSRLLLRCAPDRLPQRVRSLFAAPALRDTPLAWRRAWPLRVPRVAAPGRIAVTALRGWLRCPLRFYLRHVLRMQPVDPAKSELDAFDFGTLVHAALESLANDAAARDSVDPALLRGFLLGEFDRAVRRRYGTELTLPLVVQVESAHQRLSKAAEVQAAERAAGWTIVRAEQKFELPVAGLVVAGKIDRIERHERSGAVRVLDYKTSDTAVDPADAHLAKVKPGEQFPAWALVEHAGSRLVWTDLQLPLYRQVLAAEFGVAVECGYFNLPKATNGTGIRIWPGFDANLQAAAAGCAEGVARAVRAREFAPPRELTAREGEWDEYADLFHGGAGASVVWAEDET